MKKSNIKELIKYCYNHERAIKEALINGGCTKELKKFETFKQLANEGHIDVDTMERSYDSFFKLEKDWIRYQINLKFNEIEDLDFEKLANMLQ